MERTDLTFPAQTRLKPTKVVGHWDSSEPHEPPYYRKIKLFTGPRKALRHG